MKTPKKRSLWPIAIAIYFAFAILGIVIFVTWVVRQKSELVRPDYYAEELQFQQHLDRLNQTVQSDSEADISFDKINRVLRLRVPKSTAEIHGEIQLYRPSEAAQDKSLKLSVNENGLQEIDGKNLLPGFWKVRVKWESGGARFFTETAIVVPGNS